MLVDNGNVGDELRRRRLERKLTQRALADRLGTSQSYVAQIEGGTRAIRFATLVETARALDLEVVLIPRERLAAVEAMLAEGVLGEMPPLAGGTW